MNKCTDCLEVCGEWHNFVGKYSVMEYSFKEMHGRLILN